MPDKAESVRRKVFIVDDHPVVRQYLAALIQEEADLEVCGDAADVPAALTAIGQVEPDIVILDVSSKPSHGLDSLRRLKAQHPGLPILVLSLHGGVLRAERAMQAGAAGYLTKQEATVNILPAIRYVLEGQLSAISRAPWQPPWRELTDQSPTLNYE